MTDFKSLNLAGPVQDALERQGYTTPTPIQQKAIPKVLAGNDLMGIAQTGTGKTAAFSLPTLSYLADNPKDPPKRGARVLVLAPTRELASQIAVSIRDYGVSMPDLSVACVFGGVPIHRQIKKLVHGNDVLVATPGRLIDLINRKDIRLKDVEVLILDEADQMMDMGFIHALRHIIPLLPKERQTLFFSATMTPPIKKLAVQFLTDPVQVSVTPPNSTADNIEQSVIFVDQKQKQDLLAITLLSPDIERALIFTRTKHGADRVVKKLAFDGIPSVAIHGNKSQSQRQRALAAFRNAEIRFLVATDIAARGIDIEGITHVINFEIPNVPEQYVHRIGRTARAGRAGRAISYAAPGDERAYLKRIQKLLKATIPVEAMPEDFTDQVAEVHKRPALPRPVKSSPPPRGNKSKRKSHPAKRKKQAGRADAGQTADSSPQNSASYTPDKSEMGKRPKRRKKPVNAEALLKSDNGSAPGKKPKHKNRQGESKSVRPGQANSGGPRPDHTKRKKKNKKRRPSNDNRPHRS